MLDDALKEIYVDPQLLAGVQIRYDRSIWMRYRVTTVNKRVKGILELTVALISEFSE